MQTLRLFCDIARHHSFSRAAGEHGITQSAASQRVSQLEKKLGVTLIDRSVRPLGLTAAGEAFLRGCLDLVERYDHLEHRVTNLGSPLNGHIRVTAIYSAGIELLNRASETFRDINPSSCVTVTYAHPDEVYETVRHDEADLGIVSYPGRLRGVGVIPFREERMVLVTGPSHPLAGLASIQAEALKEVSLVNFDDTLPAGRRIKRYLREHGAVVRITSTFDNIDTIKSAVAVTDQAAILPRRLVEREVRARTLVAVTLTPALTRPVGVIYRRRNGGRDFSPAVRAFLDWLLNWAETEAPSEVDTDREGDKPTAAWSDTMDTNRDTAVSRNGPASPVVGDRS